MRLTCRPRKNAIKVLILPMHEIPTPGNSPTPLREQDSIAQAGKKRREVIIGYDIT